MGYELHITKQQNWEEIDPLLKISLEDWLSYVLIDEEMCNEGFAEVSIDDNTSISVQSPGLAVWTKYSKTNEAESMVWFDWSAGNIDVKNPDQEIINKMVEIANRLGATVQGDDGEFYAIEAWLGEEIINRRTAKTNKPWWKLW